MRFPEEYNQILRAFKIRVEGKVQGVFYRKYTQVKAQELGLCGHVQNLEDGNVSIEVEGVDAGLDEFIAWCNEGSPASKVSRVFFEEIKISGHTSFSIRR